MEDGTLGGRPRRWLSRCHVVAGDSAVCSRHSAASLGTHSGVWRERLCVSVCMCVCVCAWLTQVGSTACLSKAHLPTLWGYLVYIGLIRYVYVVSSQLQVG